MELLLERESEATSGGRGALRGWREKVLSYKVVHFEGASCLEERSTPEVGGSLFKDSLGVWPAPGGVDLLGGLKYL